MIKIAEPIIGPEEIAAVNAVLNSGSLAQGPKVAELEKDFAAYCGTKYALAVNSGTAAIHAALFAAGVQPGNEVITTPFTFIATVNPIIMLGAKPVFVDIDPVSFNINAQALEAVITEKTKAIIPIHLYGQSYDHETIDQIAKKYKLRVIEDACQAVGATYKKQNIGNLGDLACFSLYATKNIMCGEGGMVTTNNPAYADAIRRFRQHGMNNQYSYEHYGYNYRLTDLQAAIAVEQLKKVDEFTASRRANAELYNQQLKSIPGLILPTELNDRKHVYHQYTIRVTEDFAVNRDQLAEQLRTNDIIAGVYYPRPLHEFPHVAKYGYSLGDFPVAEEISRQVISLPIHPKVSNYDIKKIVQVIKEIGDIKN